MENKFYKIECFDTHAVNDDKKKVTVVNRTTFGRTTIVLD